MDWIKRMMRGEQHAAPASTPLAPSWDALVAQTRSPDGRQRQDAVRALVATGHAGALPAMLERANDWVLPIRREAREAVSNFLRPEFTDAWITSLEAVEALTRGRRDDHTSMVERIVAWLMEPAQSSRLRDAQVSLPRVLARVALRLRLRDREPSALQDQTWLVAFMSPDIVQALIATDHLRQVAARWREDDGPASESLRQAVRVSMASRFSGVRKTGLRIALANPSLATLADIRAACFDVAASNRELAIAALRDDESALRDVTTRALTALGADNPVRTRVLALGALCTIDRTASLVHCQTLRHDASPVLRFLALRHLLAQGQGESRDALVLDALVDLSPRVRKLAVAAVLRGANPPSLAQMQALTAAHPHALASLCSVAARLSPWDRLDYLLDAISSNGDALVEHLDAWNIDMGHTYVTPTAAQRERLCREWTAKRDGVPPEMQRKLEFHLRSFGVLDA